MGDRVLGRQERRAEHHVLQQVPLLGRELPDRIDVLNAGDVDDVPELPFVGSRVDDCLHVLVARQVRLDPVERSRCVAVLDQVCRFAHPRLVDVRTDDRQAVRGECDRRCLPDPRGCPRDERDCPVLEPRIVDLEDLLPCRFRRAEFCIRVSHSYYWQQLSL